MKKALVPTPNGNIQDLNANLKPWEYAKYLSDEHCTPEQFLADVSTKLDLTGIIVSYNCYSTLRTCKHMRQR